ncbi:superkiller protein 3 [Fistulifera solaris]|uniref:Superkiller protein 3 n=1 Tax=Fistulifera solaris TaxID=1519565 RepID=A0A1Z5KB77_FISSO|nr:superkiller protein 3 [Fistulifera solaris]|eukprot:GAX23395.1 superkiller protein 3 [Fistulifera solaris]
MAASVPSMKAYLEEIKKEFLDHEGKQFTDYILCLICLEVLQRGVIVPITSHDPSKIVAAARDAAGKTLLDQHSSIPKPVLAGSAVIAGRLAEAACQFYQANFLKDMGAFKKDVQSAITRCGEVNEKRLAAILQIVLYQPVSENDAKVMQFLSVLAEGYYYRAASFQPDAPPMWKRAWDVAVERHKTERRSDIWQNPETPWEIVVPLEQLCRIASSKGNEARVTELSLTLAESALDVSHAPESNDSLGKLLREQFIAPYRSIVPGDRSEALQLASDALQKAANASAVEQFAWSVLDVRLQLEREENEIAETAKIMHTKAVHRGEKPLTLEKYHMIAQQQVLGSTASDDSILKKAAHIRDKIFVALLQTDKDEASILRFRQACSFIGENFCDRLTMRAKSISISKKMSNEVMLQAWQDVLGFIFPIFDFIRSQSTWSHTSKEIDRIAAVKLFLDSTIVEFKTMIENIAYLCPLAEWMSQGMISENEVESDYHFDRVMLVLVRDTLVFLHAEATADHIEKGESVVASSVGIKQRRLKKLEVNIACSTNMLALSGIFLGETPRSLVDSAINRISSLPDDDTCMELEGSGILCLDFFICWWGLQRRPWMFCTLPESRTITKRARRAFNVLQESWGRPSTLLERCLLELGEADAEGIHFSGGLAVTAEAGYQRVQNEARGLCNDTLKELLVAVSTAGLAAVRITQLSMAVLVAERVASFVQNFRESLQLCMKLLKDGASCKVHMWTNENEVHKSLDYQVAALRQFLANVLIESGDEAAATELLEAAVQDAPNDASAATALGTFRLRIMLVSKDSSATETKIAHVQLMKAARLDSSKSDPFALLGYWYETHGDKQRALRCYTKAALLDPSQPVAGRGLLRLAQADSLLSSIEEAVNTGSPLSGWAWRVIATRKAQDEGKDDLAILSYLNCLRCRDVDCPQNEPHGMFYSDPTKPCCAPSIEKSVILGELANCYRRLGRFTASIRTFRVAIEEGGEHVLPSIYCGCGQVELELGLYADANSNFQKAAQGADSTELAWAMYGQGVSFLALAQRDFHQEKFGSAFTMLKQGIESCGTPFQHLSMSFSKLLGDLYTFGASLPSDVFVGFEEEKHDETECKLAFVAKGEAAFLQAIETHTNWEGEDKALLEASLLSDLATNKLLRAQILISTSYDIEKGKQLFEEAAEVFRQAIGIYPQNPAAWCGLGSSVFNSDPLLAQHAFCQSIDLENQFQDAYANLSFLYTENGALSQSANVSNALTQVADTPMMWINRALILEREVATESSGSELERKLSQAADAYMASLQVERNARAICGAAVTKRASSNGSRDNNKVEIRYDSFCLSAEYHKGIRSDDTRAALLHQLLSWEMDEQKRCVQGENPSTSHSNQIEASIDKLGNEAFSRDYIKSIESFIKERPTVEGNVVACHHPNHTELSSSRKIIHNPTKGEMWLALAEKLISDSHGDNRRDHLDAALTATDRAVYMMRSQLARSVDSPLSSTRVNAKDLSGALALKYWLENIFDGFSASKSPRSNNEALQMSLMMYPNNITGREAFKLQSIET